MATQLFFFRRSFILLRPFILKWVFLNWLKGHRFITGLEKMSIVGVMLMNCLVHRKRSQYVLSLCSSHVRAYLMSWLWGGGAQMTEEACLGEVCWCLACLSSHWAVVPFPKQCCKPVGSLTNHSFYFLFLYTLGSFRQKLSPNKI